MDSIVGALKEMRVTKMKNVHRSLAFLAQNVHNLLHLL